MFEVGGGRISIVGFLLVFFFLQGSRKKYWAETCPLCFHAECEFGLLFCFFFQERG